MSKRVVQIHIDKENNLFYDFMKQYLPVIPFSKEAFAIAKSCYDIATHSVNYTEVKLASVLFDPSKLEVLAFYLVMEDENKPFKMHEKSFIYAKAMNEFDIYAEVKVSMLESFDIEIIKNNIDVFGGRRLYTITSNSIGDKNRERIISYLEKKFKLTGFVPKYVTVDITNASDIRIYQISYIRKNVENIYLEDKTKPKLMYNHKYSIIFQALGNAYIREAIDNLGSASEEDFKEFEDQMKRNEIQKVIKKITDAFSDFHLEDYQGFFGGFDRPVVEFYLEGIEVKTELFSEEYDVYKITDSTNIIKALRKLHDSIPTEEERNDALQAELEDLIDKLSEYFEEYGFYVDEEYNGYFKSYKYRIAEFFLGETHILLSSPVVLPNTNFEAIKLTLEKLIRRYSIVTIKEDPKNITLEAIKKQFPEMYFVGDRGLFPEMNIEVVKLEEKRAQVRLSLKRDQFQPFYYSSLKELLDAIGRVKASILHSKKSKEDNEAKKAESQKKLLVQGIKDKFPKIVFSKDLNHGYFDILDEDVIFIEGEKTKVRESFDTVSFKEYSTGNTKDIVSSIVKLKEGIPSKAKGYIESLEELTKESLVVVYENKNLIKEMLRAFNYLVELKISLSLMKESLKKANKLLDSISSIDMDHINSVKDMILEYKETLNEDLKEKILDEIYLLKDKEEIFIKDLIDEFDRFILDEASETVSTSGKRRVYIRKRLIKQYMSFDKDVRDSINEIVRNMRTLDGHEFLTYLRNRLRMNEPFSPINHKVRLRNVMDSQMRMCFWQGKDFQDRSESRSDIYIYYFVLEHDRDIEKLKDIVPEKYEENDFVIFTLDQNLDSALRIPELKREQFRLASALDGPKVVYGCAGSGKTLVSIDQYWQIQKDYQLTGEKIAYVTFQKTLKKNAEDMIRALGVTPYCYTLPEYFHMILRVTYNTRRITGEEEFLSWFRKYYIEDGHLYNHNQEISNILRWNDCERIVYTYLRGIYKGSSLLAKVRKTSYLSWDEFYSELSVKEEFLSDRDIKEIFTACERYRLVMEENNWIDDNDLAYETLEAIREGKSRQMDYLLVDEVQDLTALQIYAVLQSLSKNKRDIYFYGDPHQTVNPTIFDDSTLKGAVSEIMGLPLKESDELAEIHRTNPNLKRYLMALQQKRKEFLGSYMDGYAKIPEIEHLEESKDDMWAAYIMGMELESYILHEGFNKGAIIITPDNIIKDSILKKYPDIDENRIFTIYEAKGMEWDKAILYHMLSSSVSYFKDMVSGKAKKSTICRMFYNKFYVAATRARDTFLLVEDELPLEITESMLESLPRITEESQASLYLGEEATFAEWVYEANRFLDTGEYKRAFYPMLKARTLVETKEEYSIVTKLFRKSRLNSAPKDELISYGDEAYKAHEYASAATFYINADAYDMANLCRIMQGLQLKKMEYMEEFLKADMPRKHPECIPNLVKDPFFKEHIQKLYERLYGKQ